jgi:hypothetical protein
MWSWEVVHDGTTCDVPASKCRRRTIWFALILVSCSGCWQSGDKYDRLPISGTVTLDGQPLAAGYLIFEPMNGQPTQSGGMIGQGKFDVPRKSGPIAGKYSVAIFSGAEAPVGNFAPGTPEAESAVKKVTGERVPPRYNINTTLTVDVKQGDPNVFAFELSSKKQASGVVSLPKADQK